MVAPLVVLATLSIFIFYTPNPVAPDAGWFLGSWVKTPAQVVPLDTRYDFMQPAMEGHHAEVHGEIVNSPLYTETMHWAHYPSMIMSITLAGIGVLFAFLFYQWKKLNPDKLADRIKFLYKGSLNKWYLDEAYDKTAVSGTLGLGSVLSWFDAKIVDGAVNGSAWLTRLVSSISGWFDANIVDGFVNATAFVSGFIGLSFKKLQTGKVQTYIVLVVFSIIILLFLFKPF